MDYIELSFPYDDACMAEIVVAELSDFAFDSFEVVDARQKAYIPQMMLADCKDQVDAILDRYQIRDRRYISIETQNWNALWESNFQQVEVEGKALIRAPFHDPAPEGVLDILIEPRMSFGTGHHATTWLVTRAIFNLELEGKKGLDMGSGTGVLAIVAAKLGAVSVDAVDIDDWADSNCRDNCRDNGVETKVNPMLGDVRLIEGRSYDFILANINRNILLGDMAKYVATLNPGADLLMSGFLEQDADAIEACAVGLGLQPVSREMRDGWMMVHVRR